MAHRQLELTLAILSVQFWLAVCGDNIHPHVLKLVQVKYCGLCWEKWTNKLSSWKAESNSYFIKMWRIKCGIIKELEDTKFHWLWLWILYIFSTTLHTFHYGRHWYTKLLLPYLYGWLKFNLPRYLSRQKLSFWHFFFSPAWRSKFT